MEVIAVVVLALLWAFLAGNLSLYNLLLGGLLGLLLLTLVQGERERSLPRRVAGFSTFLVRFLAELMVSNIVVALLALRPKPRFHPHIIAVPLRLESDAAISLLSATITLLPGTVAMGVSEDGRTLYAHAINEADPERSRDSVTRIEDLILGFMS